MGINRDRFLRKKSADQSWAEWLSDDAPSESPSDGTTKPKSFLHRRLAAKRQAIDQPTVVTPTVHRRLHAPVDNTADQSEVTARVASRAAPEVKSSPQLPVNDSGTNISINIKLPTLRRPTMPSFASRLGAAEYRYWAVFGVTVIMLSIGSRALLGRLPVLKDGKKDVKGVTTVQKQKDPTFKPAIPDNNKEAIQKKHSYDATRDLYSFEDELLNVKITVSQQPLPAMFKQNPDSLKEVAIKIGATDKIETAFGDAYIATSQNKSSQRVVAIHKDILMFIETIKTYDTDTWKLYLDSLR